ncbi:MAG: NTP transferase domain-containing protein [Vicinamibacterales bacterium]
MQVDVKAILLAAGRGSRLSPLTDDRPKAMVELDGKPLLHHQLEVLHGAGVADMSIVTGYRGDRIAHPSIPIRRIENPRWETTNMVASLYCAAAELSSAAIVAYTDIVYQPSVVEALLACPADICVVVDTGFLVYWSLRFDDPLADVESLQMDAQGLITKIGDKVTDLGEVQAQYIGLMKFSAAGAALLRRTLHALRDQPGFDKMFMTDLLRHLIHSGHPVQAVPHRHGWVEIDSASDLELARRMLTAREGKPLFDPGAV